MKHLCFHIYAKIITGLMLMFLCRMTAYAQKSVGSDDLFVYNDLFTKQDFSKKYKPTQEHIWDTWKHEFLFYEGAGYSAIAGLADGGFGNNTGLLYGCNFLNEDNSAANLTLLVGAGLGIYSARYRNKDFAFGYSLFENDKEKWTVNGTEFDVSPKFIAVMTNVNETSRMFYLNIPIMLRYIFSMSFFGSATGVGGYQFGSPDVHSFYVAAGARVGIPVYTSFSMNYAQAELFMNDFTMQEPGKEPGGEPYYGLGKTYNKNLSGALDPEKSVMLSFEFGYIFPLSKIKYNKPWHERVLFYGGIYFDYTLNRNGTQFPSALMYDERNSIDDTGGNFSPIPKPITATNVMRNMTIGFKLSVSYTLEKN